MLGGLNARLQELQDALEKDLATAFADYVLVNVTTHLTPRRRCRGGGRCMCQMRQEGRQVMGRGDYTLVT